MNQKASTWGNKTVAEVVAELEWYGKILGEEVWIDGDKKLLRFEKN